MITYDVKLCIGHDEQDRKLIVKCHDTGINLRVFFQVHTKGTWRDEFVPYTIPEGSTAVLKINKPDNTYCVIDGEVESICALFELPPQAFTNVGRAGAEINLYGPTGKRVTTGTFELDITSECLCEASEAAGNYVSVMAKQIQGAKDAETAAGESAKKAGESAEAAAKSAERSERAVAHTPIIRNGNWWVWDTVAGDYIDTKVNAEPFPPDFDQNDMEAPDYIFNKPMGKDQNGAWVKSEYMEVIKREVLEDIPTAAQVQSDLDQNDPNAVDYVKNRPFYAEETVIVEEQTVVPHEDEDVEGYYAYVFTNSMIEEGVNYLVTFNGEKYACNAYILYDEDADMFRGIALGNIDINTAANFGDVLDNKGNGEPFAIIQNDGTTEVYVAKDGTYTVKVTEGGLVIEPLFEEAVKAVLPTVLLTATLEDGTTQTIKLYGEVI